MANTIGCREFEIIIVVASRSASTASWRRSGRATAGALNSPKDHLITSISLMNDFATPLPLELSVSIAIPNPLMAGALLLPNSRLKASAIE